MENSYIAIKLNAGNDVNGNPRRGWLVYHDLPTDAREWAGGLPCLGWIEEGYRYSSVAEAIAAYEARVNIDAAGTDERVRLARAGSDLTASGRLRELGYFAVPYSEIREAREAPFKLPASE